MKKVLLTLAAVTVVASLAGCAPGNNTPGSTIVGATAGGLLGGPVLGGGVGGAAAGALIGGGAGYMVGRSMDRQDAIYMQNAIGTTAIAHDYTWTNPRTHVCYVVRPTREFMMQSRTCRHYTTRVKIGGKWRTATGTACRMSDGSWKVVR